MAQVIRVIIKAINKFSRGANQVKKDMDVLGTKTRTLQHWSGKLNRNMVDLERGLKMQGLAVNKAGRVYSTYTGQIQKTSTAMKKASLMTRGFKMELLSVMFFGMLLQRVFMGLMRTGVEAMMKITEGQTQAGQTVLQLSAAFQFLKFTVGEAIGTALTPFIDTIVGVIDAISNWIEQNPELFTTLLMVGAAVGTLMFAFGTLGLGIDGVVTTVGKLKWSKIAGGINTVRNALSPLMIKIMIIIAAVVLLWQAWEHNWFNIRQTTGTIVKGIANAFFYLVEAGQILYSGMVMVWNGIVSSIQWAANGIIDIINAIGGAYAWLTGREYKAMEKWNLQPMIVDLKEVNKQIDEWQQKTGQAIYGLGEDIYLSGERMNRGTTFGEDKYSITRMMQGAMGEVMSGFNVNEMNINVNATNVEGAREAGHEVVKGMKEEMSYAGGTTVVT